MRGLIIFQLFICIFVLFLLLFILSCFYWWYSDNSCLFKENLPNWCVLKMELTQVSSVKKYRQHQCFICVCVCVLYRCVSTHNEMVYPQNLHKNDCKMKRSRIQGHIVYNCAVFVYLPTWFLIFRHTHVCVCMYGCVCVYIFLLCCVVLRILRNWTLFLYVFNNETE